VHESLRAYLKREVPPERVWQALEAAMLGNNESARVSASRVLMDALAEPDRTKDEEAQTRRANAWALQRLSKLLDDRARSYEVREVRLAMDELAAELDLAAERESPDLIAREPNPEQVAVMFVALEERGLVAPISRVEKLAEQKAQERLAALREEHGIPA